MYAVFKKEFRSSMTGMTGPIFIFAVLFVLGFFVQGIQLSGSPKVELSVVNGAFWSLILTPILTMRLFSEERKTRTDQLLYALPISTTSVVLGKYFAMVAVFAIPCAVLALYPVLFAFFAPAGMNFIMAYGAIIAYFFLGCAVIALGMLISSLFESQVICAILNLAILLALYFLTSSASAFSGIIAKVVSAISLFNPIIAFAYDTFDITCFVYYISVAALFIFLTVQSFENRRWH